MSVKMSTMEDPTRFTKRTATILRGLGASSLIPEFERRNISTRTLHELTKEDFVRLGADEEKAEEMRKNLKIRWNAKNAPNTRDKIEHYLEMIQDGERHLSLAQCFVAYCRLRLTKERINFFVDPDKCLSASQTLRYAVDATLDEAKEAQKTLRDLRVLISKMKPKKKRSVRRLCCLVTTLGVAALFTLKLLYR